MVQKGINESGYVMKAEEVINETIKNSPHFAYVRVSSVEQSIDRQIKAIKDYGKHIDKTFIEKLSGKDNNRPELQKMLEHVREGDTVVISELSRISRSIKGLNEIQEELTKKGVKLVSLKEQLDTKTPTGKLMINMIGVINEFERENIRERQMQGIAIAKEKGKYKGRKRIKKPNNFADVYIRYKVRDITAKEAMNLLGLRRNKFYEFVREHEESINELV